jgi:hypothetical protein
MLLACIISALTMEAASTSETSMNSYHTTWHNHGEDSHLITDSHENLKCCQTWNLFFIIWQSFDLVKLRVSRKYSVFCVCSMMPRSSCAWVKRNGVLRAERRMGASVGTRLLTWLNPCRYRAAGRPSARDHLVVPLGDTGAGVGGGGRAAGIQPPKVSDKFRMTRTIFTKVHKKLHPTYWKRDGKFLSCSDFIEFTALITRLLF